MNEHPVVVALTGASGLIYGRRLVDVLLQTGTEIHLTISDSARIVAGHELQLQLDLEQFDIQQLIPDLDQRHTGRWHYHHYRDFMTPIASGSFQTRAMVVCPCSGGTLSGIATAASRNLIQRAADVHLKERRPLILVPREAPLSLIQIDNLRTAAQAGATILPASPGFYHGTKTIDDLVDFIVARILDQVGVERELIPRWGSA